MGDNGVLEPLQQFGHSETHGFEEADAGRVDDPADDVQQDVRTAAAHDGAKQDLLKHLERAHQRPTTVPAGRRYFQSALIIHREIILRSGGVLRRGRQNLVLLIADVVMLTHFSSRCSAGAA